MKTLWDLEIKMLIPFDLIIYYPDDFKDEYIEEPSFKKIRELLKIVINVQEIVEELYENRGRKSSVSVYYSNDSFKNFILFDTEIGETDQLDLITIGIRCSTENSELIRQYAHDFYTKRCEYNIIYSEGNYEIIREFGVDFSLFSNISENIIQSNFKKRKINLFQSGNLIYSFK